MLLLTLPLSISVGVPIIDQGNRCGLLKLGEMKQAKYSEIEKKQKFICYCLSLESHVTNYQS